MKIKELRRKSKRELNDFLKESRQKLGQLKFDLTAKKLKDVRQMRELRRDIARVLTLTREQKHE